MKKLSNNKKGFTLIELLAVIVILAILVMVAIPAVTKYLNEARQGTYADSALKAIDAVRTDVISKGFADNDGTATNIALSGNVLTYDKDAINNLMEKTLDKSSFGSSYKHVKIAVTQDTSTGNTTYYMCLIDEAGNGFQYTPENELDKTKVAIRTHTGENAGCGTVDTDPTPEETPTQP